MVEHLFYYCYFCFHFHFSLIQNWEYYCFGCVVFLVVLLLLSFSVFGGKPQSLPNCEYISLILSYSLFTICLLMLLTLSIIICALNEGTVYLFEFHLFLVFEFFSLLITFDRFLTVTLRGPTITHWNYEQDWPSDNSESLVSKDIFYIYFLYLL